MMIKGAVKIKTILVIIILLLVGVLGVVGMGAVRTYMSGAAASEGPKGVVASTSADGKTVNISFTTDKEEQPTVMYGASPTSIFMSKTAEAKGKDHSFDLTSLKVNSTYYYVIEIGGVKNDNGGIPWSFSTAVKEDASIPTETPIPTVATSSESTCDHTTDYNGDGVVNSLDYLECIKGKSTPAPASTDDCVGKDYNKDGVINAVDALQCGQNKKK